MLFYCPIVCSVPSTALISYVALYEVKIGMLANIFPFLRVCYRDKLLMVDRISTKPSCIQYLDDDNSCTISIEAVQQIK